MVFVVIVVERIKKLAEVSVCKVIRDFENPSKTKRKKKIKAKMKMLE